MPKFKKFLNEASDTDVKKYSDEQIKKMSKDELAKLTLDGKKLSDVVKKALEKADGKVWDQGSVDSDEDYQVNVQGNYETEGEWRENELNKDGSPVNSEWYYYLDNESIPGYTPDKEEVALLNPDKGLIYFRMMTKEQAATSFLTHYIKVNLQTLKCSDTGNEHAPDGCLDVSKLVDLHR